MRRRPGPLPDRLLVGVLALTAVLLATSLALALKPEGETAAPTGVVTGTVTAWPCNSVETPADPPCPGYHGEIRILRPDGALFTTAQTDRAGRYRVELPPGRYVVDPNDDGKSLANGDGRVTVREGLTERVDLTHYTGLLCALGRTWLHAAGASAHG